MTLLMREREKYKEGIADGEIKGTVETYEDLGFSFQETVNRIAEKFGFSLQQSEEEVNKYWG